MSDVSSPTALDPGFWRGRRVLITGHTGFKGSWLALWLQALGASVSGIADGVPTSPALYELARLRDGLTADVRADIRDPAAMDREILRIDPEIVIHLAAQPLVRRSYDQPRETFATNVMGTANVLDTLRRTPAVRVIINVTSDKSYENRSLDRGYREDDPLGGADPYSASKGAAELVTSAYRRSFFADPDGPRLASARAGNVIGGGDWGADRLVSDLARAAISGDSLHVRNPAATRPWQHVLNPLSGYLLLAQRLWSDPNLAGAWNFGPPATEAIPVRELVEQLRSRWGGRPDWAFDPGPHPHEAQVLALDSAKARLGLGWCPPVPLPRALDSIVSWFSAFADGEDMREVTSAQITGLTAPLRQLP